MAFGINLLKWIRKIRLPTLKENLISYKYSSFMNIEQFYFRYLEFTESYMVEYCLKRPTHLLDGNELQVTKSWTSIWWNWDTRSWNWSWSISELNDKFLFYVLCICCMHLVKYHWKSIKLIVVLSSFSGCCSNSSNLLTSFVNYSRHTSGSNIIGSKTHLVSRMSLVINYLIC